jgi:hypothetical protein
MYTEICTLQTGAMEFPWDDYNGDFNIYASFEYVNVQLGGSGWLNAYLFDVTGRNVATLASGVFEAGNYRMTLPKNLGAGVYFVRAAFDGVLKSTKIIRCR